MPEFVQIQDSAVDVEVEFPVQLAQGLGPGLDCGGLERVLGTEVQQLLSGSHHLELTIVSAQGRQKVKEF